jgi:thiazole/oxazole-forming peptide maturase SagD family component
MLEYYPSHVHCINQFRRISSQHGGITESQLLFCNRRPYTPNLHVCANQMPEYEKILISDEASISYHISGYGLFREEAMVRVYGESIERYGLLVTPSVIQDKVIYKTYNQLKKEHPDEIIPWEYIKIFSEDDYKMLEPITNIKSISQDNMIGWLKCPSIFDSKQSYYIPAQCLFVGYKPNKEVCEEMFVPGFSKGSACHTSEYKALISAIMESIESDAFMINWYTNYKAKEIIVDDVDLLKMINTIIGSTNYELKILDMSIEDMPGYAIGVILKNKKKQEPFIIMGCSASLNLKEAVYRALTEASTIDYLASNGPMMRPRDYLGSHKDKVYLDLDSNVSYWSSLTDYDIKSRVINELASEKRLFSSYDNKKVDDDKNNLRKILMKMKSHLTYGIYLDITPIEIAREGVKVMRVFFPEMVQLSFPGYPYKNHKRLLQYGGVSNELPHPLP